MRRHRTGAATTHTHLRRFFRHYATHLFWLGGGFACFLLARRLFGSGPLALLAMLLFLLHPRLYAHAFFNSNDFLK